jgi:hypothetical protein
VLLKTIMSDSDFGSKELYYLDFVTCTYLEILSNLNGSSLIF